MTYRKRADANQPVIVAALRVAGYFPVLLFRAGNGIPDLLIPSKANPARTMLMEIKMPGETLTVDEQIFFEMYPGRACIAQTPEQALQIMGDYDREED